MEIATKPVRVFLADDSTAIRVRLVELLGPLSGVELVGQAATVEDAIVGILRERPDCVVLDLQLRGGNGLTVLRAVQAQVPASVFAVLTNHADKRYRDACLAAGAQYFFDKSSEFQRIRDVVRMIGGGRPGI
ncbi:response regulator [Chitinimonas koreensis]|uniref:response regulator n=1 Tax=Chitinimonas koreensis TaxID=356302 RepID=UPI0003F8D99B|nr:response regulator transcription factor [Chitinimonas koreensis]QNM97760.1 response regulator transcription factor [Chitinimonas koreensis]